MDWLTWRSGRSNTGYHKLLLFQWPWYILCDLYLLCFPEMSSAPMHIDPVPGYRHYRVNYVIKKARCGGVFRSFHFIYCGAKLKIFRSDRPHEVTPIVSGTRYVLSFGICFPEKEGERE